MATIAAPTPVGSNRELSSTNFSWLSKESLYLPHSLSAEDVVVLDLQTVARNRLLDVLEPVSRLPIRPTFIALGNTDQLEDARPYFENLSASFVLRPDNITDQAAIQFVYDQMASIYAPFSRLGTEFLPSQVSQESNTPMTPKDPRQNLLSAVFGDDDVRPVATEIAPEYTRPPFAFDQVQVQQLFDLVNKPETEVR